MKSDFSAGLLIGMGIAIVWVSCAVHAADDMVKRGAYLYNTSRPACESCHTETRNSLADYGSRGSIADAKEWLRRPSSQFEKAGKKGMMPSYKMPDEDVEALAFYLMTLEE